MKILLMNQFFWPDNAATSQLLTDLARDLAAQGHKVYVICGGTYAETSAEDAPAADIHRISAFRFSRGAVGRVLSYLSFYVGATWQALSVARPDVVVTLTTPPLLSLIGALVRRIRGSHFYIWEMDMYPDVAVDVGFLHKGSLLHRVTGLLADWARRQADGIIALGSCMKSRLVERGVPSSKVTVVHNWADSRQIKVSPFALRDGRLQVVYSGNLGLAHDLDTLTSAIEKLKDDQRFHFLFVGGGARRKELDQFVAQTGVTSVERRSYVPRAELGNTLGLGDIGLVTQCERCCGSVVPSKVYGLMAAGRPILFIGPAAATPAEVIRTHHCGWHINCGDSDALVRLLQHLAEHPEEVKAAGNNARQALESHYDRLIGTDSIIKIVTSNIVLPAGSPSPKQLPAENARSAAS